MISANDMQNMAGSMRAGADGVVRRINRCVLLCVYKSR